MVVLVLRVGLSLAVVLGLFWAVARVGSKRMGGSDRTLMRVRGRQALSRTASVTVVEVGSRVLVLGVAESGVRLLTELDPEELPGDRSAAPPVRLEAVAGVRSVAAPAASSAPAPSAPAAAAQGRLAGSLLSAGTWRQAWTATAGRRSTLPDWGSIATLAVDDE